MFIVLYPVVLFGAPQADAETRIRRQVVDVGSEGNMVRELGSKTGKGRQLGRMHY